LILVVGAGFAGAVIARQLAENGYRVKVIDQRNHLAGNCYTKRDHQTNIMEHKYGPHIFHTNDIKIWQYVNQFTEMLPYTHRVKGTTGGRVYSLPINLHTINQFFNTTMGPVAAKKFIASKNNMLPYSPVNFENKTKSLIGEELYEAFFQIYTEKQWGISASLLDASLIKRLPLRFNYDDNYYSHRYQGIPKYGYTVLIESILKHENIEIELDRKFDRNLMGKYDHTFYSGSLDEYFNYSLGQLPYRTLKFERFVGKDDFQGCSVMNYCDAVKPYTRITEFKHLTPWEEHDETIYIKEFSKPCEGDDIPYYPMIFSSDLCQLKEYRALAELEKNTSFIGRLGTYRYLDMDTTISESLNVVAKFLKINELEA